PVPRPCRPSADGLSDQKSERGAEQDDTHRGAATLRPKVVRQQRQRARLKSSLSDSNTDSAQEQGEEIPCQSTRRRHQRPGGRAQRDQALAAEALCQPADRKAEERIENRKPESL